MATSVVRTVLVALFVIFLAAHTPAREPLSSRRQQAVLDHYAEQYVREPCHVGISIAAHIAGKTYFSNRGSTSRVRTLRPTPDSVYELASVTKTFVGALAARALVDGRMTLDGDFRQYLPGDYPNLSVSSRPLTLRTLATHTSGLPRDLPDTDALMAEHDYDHIGERLAILNKGYTRARSLAELHQVKLRSTPGSEFAYSNLGIRVLGYGIEDAYGLPLDQLLKETIFNPLGMSSSGFSIAPAMRARIVTPYSRFDHVQPLHDASAGAAYGLYSTPRDMAQYLAWQLSPSSAIIERSHTLIRGTGEDGEALIWNVGVDAGRPILWHGGGSFGETSQMVLFPSEQEGFVLLTNDTCEGSETRLRTLAIAVRDALASNTTITAF